MKRFCCMLLALLLAWTAGALADRARYTSPTDDLPLEEVQARLAQLGYLELRRGGAPSDADTVAALLAFEADQGLTEEPTDGVELLPCRTVVRVYQAADDGEPTVWVPVYGGKRYHGKPGCSQMDSPEAVSLQAAKDLGFTPCGRCHPPQ